MNDALLFLVRHCKSLYSLKVGEIESEKFKEIMENCTMPLTELGTGWYSIREEFTLAASFLPWVSKLKILDLKFMSLNSEGHCQLLGCCPALEELEVRNRGVIVVSYFCKFMSILCRRRGVKIYSHF